MTDEKKGAQGSEMGKEDGCCCGESCGCGSGGCGCGCHGGHRCGGCKFLAGVLLGLLLALAAAGIYHMGRCHASMCPMMGEEHCMGKMEGGPAMMQGQAQPAKPKGK